MDISKHNSSGELSMSVRIATFNVENLMSRFDFSGFKDKRRRDRTLAMMQIDTKKQYNDLEQARVIAHSDDARQLTALAIKDCDADILCLQEVEDLDALEAFEYGYLFKMVGNGYRNKYLIDGNDSRGIDVAVMTRDETKTGEKIEFVAMKTHKDATYESLDVFNNELKQMGEKPDDLIFRRDCLEIDFKIGGKPLTLFVCHFKSMGSRRNGMEGRDYTMPVRMAEAMAVRKIIENRFGEAKAGDMRWMVCGDLNDYQRRLVIDGGKDDDLHFTSVEEEISGINPLTDNGFGENLIARRDPNDQWTLFHTRGPEERHLCQLDYLIASPYLSSTNATAIPNIIRNGQPWRVNFPPDQAVDRYPRTGWDRPKASDHCPVVVELNLI
jgi:predicted extracellular nuclease